MDVCLVQRSFRPDTHILPSIQPAAVSSTPCRGFSRAKTNSALDRFHSQSLHPATSFSSSKHSSCKRTRLLRVQAASPEDPPPRRDGPPSSASNSGDDSTPKSRSPRTLTAEDRKALGLPPLKGQTPSTPPPQSTPQNTPPAPPPGAPGQPQQRVRRKQWTLLDEMDKEGFGYWAPDESEWGFVRTARNMGDWLLQITGEPGGSKTSSKKDDEDGPGFAPLGVLIFLVFPIWMTLTFVALGKVDLPPALAEFQALLRS